MSNKPFVVVTDGFDADLFEQLKRTPELEVYPKSKVSADELKTLLPRVNGLVIRSATTVNRELIDSAPNLKYVVRAGEGTDNVDKPYCKEKGIVAANTPGANSNSAAEHAIALMLTVLRKTAFAHKSMSEGKWEKSLFEGNELSNKTVGLIGYGKIGQLVAKRLAGFDVRVLIYARNKKDTLYPYVTQVASLEELMRKSDIVSLHMPGGESTKNLVNKQLLDLMQPKAILINAARGGIVNEEDLYHHLKEKKIRGAGFDVFSKEPLPADSQLRTLDNLVVTPHLGASTDEAQVRVGEMAVHQVQEFFLKNNILNRVN